MFSENELRLIILNNPNIQIHFLVDAYPRMCQQVTLLEDCIRVDFGYSVFVENEYSIYLRLEDYGVTWKFMNEEQFIKIVITKKIRNLTDVEMDQICDKNYKKYGTCYNCPLKIGYDSCFKYLDLDKEVEIIND